MLIYLPLVVFINNRNVVCIDLLAFYFIGYLQVEASVLVTSGSAFASVATLFKRSDASIALQFLAKEQVSGVYDVYDHAIVDRNGTILYPSPDQLKRRCENIVQHNVKLLNATRSILEA